MEISIGGESIGFLNFSLRPDVVPKTVKNFVGTIPLCTGCLAVRMDELLAAFAAFCV